MKNIRRKLSILLIAGIVSSTLFFNTQTVSAVSGQSIVVTVSKFTEKFLLPSLSQFLQKKDALNGSVEENITYLPPSKIEKGKFTITALDFDNSNSLDDIFLVEISKETSKGAVSIKKYLKSRTELTLDLSAEDYIIKMYKIVDSSPILMGACFVNDTVRENSCGIALTKILDGSDNKSTYFYLSPIKEEKYNKTLLKKYTRYDPGNESLLRSSLESQRLYYGHLTNEKEKILCKIRTSGVNKKDLLKYDNFKPSYCENMLNTWKNLEILSQTSKHMSKGTCNLSISNENMDMLIIKIKVNYHSDSSKDFEFYARPGEVINLLDKVDKKQNCTLEFFQKIDVKGTVASKFLENIPDIVRDIIKKSWESGETNIGKFDIVHSRFENSLIALRITRESNDKDAILSHIIQQ